MLVAKITAWSWNLYLTRQHARNWGIMFHNVSFFVWFVHSFRKKLILYVVLADWKTNGELILQSIDSMTSRDIYKLETHNIFFLLWLINSLILPFLCKISTIWVFFFLVFSGNSRIPKRRKLKDRCLIFLFLSYWYVHGEYLKGPGRHLNKGKEPGLSVLTSTAALSKSPTLNAGSTRIHESPSQKDWHIYLQISALQEHNALLHKLVCDNMFMA